MSRYEAADALRFEENGQLRAMVAAEATFYFTDLARAAAGLIASFDAVMDVIEPHATMYATATMRRKARYKPKVRSLFRDWFAGEQYPSEWYSLEVSSGRELESVGPWGLEFAVQPSVLGHRSSPFPGARPKPEAGHFHFSLPLESLPPGQAFLELVTKVAETLPFRSGHAGLGMLYVDGYSLPNRNQTMYAWSRRYRGLDYRSLVTTSIEMGEKVKSANWLTMLDTDFIDQLGGQAALRAALGSEVGVRDVGHGVIIQAGPQPLLGDVNRLEPMTAYERVNDAIKPIRVPLILPFPGYDKTNIVEWLTRFDRS